MALCGFGCGYDTTRAAHTRLSGDKFCTMRVRKEAPKIAAQRARRERERPADYHRTLDGGTGAAQYGKP